MNKLEKIKQFTKNFILVMFYVATVVTFIYAIWFCIKNRNNGNNIFINFLLGIIDGVLRAGHFLASRWIKTVDESK